MVKSYHLIEPPYCIYKIKQNLRNPADDLTPACPIVGSFCGADFDTKFHQEQKPCFIDLGASCHSVEDALEAQALGCTYITAGHIFETDCKKGLPGRGLDFLRNVCAVVELPVYGIGGIDSDNIALVRHAGAGGACLMSSVMVTEDVAGLMKAVEG